LSWLQHFCPCNINPCSVSSLELQT
jgi:hypothetical protein